MLAAERRRKAEDEDPNERERRRQRLEEAERQKEEDFRAQVVGRLKTLGLDVPVGVNGWPLAKVRAFYEEKVPRSFRADPDRDLLAALGKTDLAEPRGGGGSALEKREASPPATQERPPEGHSSKRQRKSEEDVEVGTEPEGDKVEVEQSSAGVPGLPRPDAPNEPGGLAGDDAELLGPVPPSPLHEEVDAYISREAGLDASLLLGYDEREDTYEDNTRCGLLNLSLIHI